MESIFHKEHWAEVRNDYNNGEGYWTIDAWETSDPDAEGKVIAVINDKTAEVYYIDSCARYSPKAQEAINERIEAVKMENRVPGLTWEDVMEISTIAKGPLEQKAPGVESYYTEALRIFNARKGLKR